ncbi:MAG: DUF86 domain-containing protein [Prevotella sp.]|jgi:uncharacterized protein with HEPN domain|nr:DUF86 domain-containing protein [Prevotella sp.]MBR7125169.1 DUF86 domain-containing protein [Prevotella sp.]
MREKVRDIERLKHILQAINVLVSYQESHTPEEAFADPVVYFGLVKHVEIIGEAVYKLTLEFRTSHSEVNWDDIERMRHVLVHGYYKIRPEQLWNTIAIDVPALKPVIERLIEEQQNVG